MKFQILREFGVFHCIWCRLATLNLRTYKGSSNDVEIKSAIETFGVEIVIFYDEVLLGLVS